MIVAHDYYMATKQETVAMFERTTATRAYVQFWYAHLAAPGELVKFESTSKRAFKAQLQAFCTERGATKIKEVRT